MLLPPMLFRGFDDRQEQSAPIADFIRPEALLEIKLEKLSSVLNILVPNAPAVVGLGLDSDGYSERQRDLQKFLEGKEPPPAVGSGPVGLIPKIIYESVYAVAWSTGSMDIAASSPAIQDYEDSALVGFGPMII